MTGNILLGLFIIIAVFMLVCVVIGFFVYSLIKVFRDKDISYKGESIAFGVLLAFCLSLLGFICWGGYQAAFAEIYTTDTFYVEYLSKEDGGKSHEMTFGFTDAIGRECRETVNVESTPLVIGDKDELTYIIYMKESDKDISISKILLSEDTAQKLGYEYQKPNVVYVGIEEGG